MRLEIERYFRHERNLIIAIWLPFFERKSSRVKESEFPKLANQLCAIEQLGKSANNQVLDYITTLSKENVQIVRSDSGPTSYSDMTSYNDSWRTEKHSYPNARGALKHFLDFDIQISRSYVGHEIEISAEELELQWAPVNLSPARQILSKAKATLEQDLASP